MRIATILALAISTFLFSGAAHPGTKKLSGPEITALLPTIIALGEDTKQTFSAFGDTRYVSGGRPSTGSWRIDQDKYCSVWPPSGDWSCFHVFLHDHPDQQLDQLIWTNTRGTEVTVNQILPK